MAELSDDIRATTDGDMERLIREVADAAVAWKYARKAGQAHEALDQSIRALAATDIDAETAVSQIAARLGNHKSLWHTRYSPTPTIALVFASVVLSVLLSLVIGTLLFQRWSASFGQQIRESVLAEVRTQQVAPTAAPSPTVAPSATPRPTVAPSATPRPTAAPSATPAPTATLEPTVERSAPATRTHTPARQATAAPPDRQRPGT